MALAVSVCVAGCQATPRQSTVATPSTISGAPTVVHVWLTTGDQTKLLNQEADIVSLRESAAPAAGLSVIDIDPGTRYQQMLGFGAAMTDASAFLMTHRMPAAARARLIRDLFGREDGIGLSLVRIPMGASDFSLRHYSYDDLPPGDRDPGLKHFSIDEDREERIPLLKLAVATNPEVKLVGSPWSAPAWMKTTGNLVKGTLLPRFYDAYANYFVKFIRAYEAEGLPVFAVTLQNEPNFEPDDYPGMRLDALQRAEIIGRHFGPRFEREGIKTQIWDWDHNWDLPQSPMEVLADSAARKYVQAVAWHCYGGDVSAQSIPHSTYPDKDTYFTECSGGDWAKEFAGNLSFNVGKLVIGATRNWARGVALWNLALDETGGPHKGGCGNCRGVVTIDSRTGEYTRNVEYYSLAHASKFVRLGARRIKSESADTALLNVAFQNADGYTNVLIVLNTAREPRAFVVRSLGRAFRYVLPASSVVSFVWS
jgi:glucosylceramidase